MLDTSHTLLNFAFDLLRHSLHLLIRAADRFTNPLLYLAGDICVDEFAMSKRIVSATHAVLQ